MKNDYYQQLLMEEKELKRSSIHSFHRYFGKLIPAIPSFAIKTFTKEGDVVLDTFSGSGTTVVEAKKLNRNGYGVDINPLAIFTSRVKTTKISQESILDELNKIKKLTSNDSSDYSGANEPYCVNIDHWFQPHVKSDLLKLRKHILKIKNDEMRDFFVACFSAFLRSVSNADPMHVFPGYSKRLRKLDAEGKRNLDVLKAFGNAVKKRARYMDDLPQNSAWTKFFEGTAKKLPNEIKDVDLVVINPPYISSIRYLETMKIEMGWLGFIQNQQDYLTMDKSVIGTERFYKKEFSDLKLTEIPELDLLIGKLEKNSQPKMARVVSQYFLDIKDSFEEINRVLKKKGHLVIKISDSNVRKEPIATHKYFIEIAEALGMKTIACFKDDFNPNSRSLLTARNTYSGIMNFDWILIFQKP